MNIEHLAVPNKLIREFDVNNPNQVWCGDAIYIWIGTRWPYLAVVLDLFSCKPIGWAMSLSPDSELTSKALMMAYESRGKPQGVMFHLDQGMHYTSRKFRQRLWQHQITQSMSRRGNCHDNAVAESFFATFKKRVTQRKIYSTRDDAKTEIFNFIEMFYNPVKRHSHTGGVSPVQFEKDYRYVLSILVCMEIGLTYIPLHIEFPDDRVNQIKRISNFESLLNNELFEKIINYKNIDSNKNSFIHTDKKNLYIMFTSGSTGEPKGVEIKRESYNNFLLWLDSYFDVDKNDTILFGRESAGVPNEVHKKIKDRLKIPMKNNKRSLNIASSVAIILAESLKQTKLI